MNAAKPLPIAILLISGWQANGQTGAQSPEYAMQQRIQQFQEDQQALFRFFSLTFSNARSVRLSKFYDDELAKLSKVPFEKLDQEGKVDYLLLKNYLVRQSKRLKYEAKVDAKAAPLLPFAETIVQLWEDRQAMKPIDGEKAATLLLKVEMQISDLKASLDKSKIAKTDAFRAARITERLRDSFNKWFNFYNGYDPMFSWWVTEPHKRVDKALEELSPAIREKVVGLKPGDKDAIVGEPIGRDALLADLDAEFIPYTPEELIKIGESEYAWCETEMKKAAKELGYDDWRKGLEHVKNLHVAPGEQTKLIRDLALEAIDYIKKGDLLTVPPLAEETWRMEMMSPERQKVSPFFLGGETIIVSFPTDSMDHEQKLMSMRGNNIHFARATVHHELIPGHHMQQFMTSRYRPYREMFSTPFWIEGWALYWEFMLWDKGFAKSPENRIGMLFWRMHRCARIVFSLKFHMGQMTPQECIDYLVEKVGHERATAEGEVRRSFGGDYSPLYQAAYMLGALQIRAMREELVGKGKPMKEKEFHDRILQENQMPIELLRALLSNQPLTKEQKPTWRFYPKP